MFQKPNGVNYVNHHKEKLKQRRKKALVYLGGVLIIGTMAFHNHIPGLKNPKPYRGKPNYVETKDSTYKDSMRENKNYNIDTKKDLHVDSSKKTLDSLID